MIRDFVRGPHKDVELTFLNVKFARRDRFSGLTVWLRTLVEMIALSCGGAIHLPRLDAFLVVQGWQCERKGMEADEDASRELVRPWAFLQQESPIQ